MSCRRTEGVQSQQAVQSLHLLQGVQLALHVRPKDNACSQHFLQLVHKLPLERLQIRLPAEALTMGIESLLAKCSSCELLVLCFPGPAQHIKESIHQA